MSEKSFQNECSICLEPLTDRSKDVGVLECNHKFHMSCIYGWFSQANSNFKCPNCFVQRDIVTIIPSETTPLDVASCQLEALTSREASPSVQGPPRKRTQKRRRTRRLPRRTTAESNSTEVERDASEPVSLSHSASVESSRRRSEDGGSTGSSEDVTTTRRTRRPSRWSQWFGKCRKSNS